MESRLKLSKTSTYPPTDASLYWSIIGSLHYPVLTRSDITSPWVMSAASWRHPPTEHLTTVKHLLRYIAGTIKYHRCYSGDAKLVGYSDGDMAGDIDNRKSTTGAILFLRQSPVTWQLQK
jgi:hypothetical protein